jgi:DNA-directed RNA polymerase subunit RPC12/RpoP
MTKGLFLLQSNKFTLDNIEVAMVCAKCDEIFTKQFPLDLEGQTIEFRCPVCNSVGEADIPFKPIEEREKIEEDLIEPEEEGVEEFDESY